MLTIPAGACFCSDIAETIPERRVSLDSSVPYSSLPLPVPGRDLLSATASGEWTSGSDVTKRLSFRKPARVPAIFLARQFLTACSLVSPTSCWVTGLALSAGHGLHSGVSKASDEASLRYGGDTAHTTCSKAARRAQPGAIAQLHFCAHRLDRATFVEAAERSGGSFDVFGEEGAKRLLWQNNER